MRVERAKLRDARGLDIAVVDARARDENVVEAEELVLVRRLQSRAVAGRVVGGVVDLANRGAGAVNPGENLLAVLICDRDNRAIDGLQAKRDRA